jgi:hypothetical protein
MDELQQQMLLPEQEWINEDRYCRFVVVVEVAAKSSQEATTESCYD